MHRPTISSAIDRDKGALMRRKRLLTLQLTGLGALSVAGLWGSTQQLAGLLGGHALLGMPWLRAGETAVYAPWMWLSMASRYYEQIPKSFDDTMLPMVVGLMAGLIFAVALRRKFGPKPVLTSHGSARWATREELSDSGLLASTKAARGVVLGRDEQGKLLVHNGKEHVFCFAPTRSGKGVGLVVPTLLTWTGSVLVLDVKGENWALTSGWRAMFSHALYFNPTDERSVHFNPLLEIRKGAGEVRDVRNVVEILCDPDGRSTGNDFWTESAKSLLTGLILHVLYAEDDKSLAGVLSFLRDPDREQEEMFEHMLSTRHLGDRPHPVVAQAARSLLNAAEKTRSGIVVTAERFLNLFEDPILAETTRTSDFRLRDLQYADHPVSLYLVVPPSDMLRLRPLLRLMLIQLGSALTEELDAGDDHHRLLLLLDEFPVLGRLDWFETALAYIAGYDIKAYLIAQDLNQIEKAYGPNNAILGNTHIRIAFAANDDRTARRISDLLGQSTATKKTESLSGKRGAFHLENKSESAVEFARPLLTPGEVTQLHPDRAIVMVAAQPPILAHKVRYYEEEHFKRRCPGLIRDPEQAKAQGWNPALRPPALTSGAYVDLPDSEPSPWTAAPVHPVEKDVSPTGEGVRLLVPRLALSSEAAFDADSSTGEGAVTEPPGHPVTDDVPSERLEFTGSSVSAAVEPFDLETGDEPGRDGDQAATYAASATDEKASAVVADDLDAFLSDF